MVLLAGWRKKNTFKISIFLKYDFLHCQANSNPNILKWQYIPIRFAK